MVKGTCARHRSDFAKWFDVAVQNSRLNISPISLKDDLSRVRKFLAMLEARTDAARAHDQKEVQAAEHKRRHCCPAMWMVKEVTERVARFQEEVSRRSQEIE
jgi:hypothetical protein